VLYVAAYTDREPGELGALRRSTAELVAAVPRLVRILDEGADEARLVVYGPRPLAGFVGSVACVRRARWRQQRERAALAAGCRHDT
jgi:hypothetical protein